MVFLNWEFTDINRRIDAAFEGEEWLWSFDSSHEEIRERSTPVGPLSLNSELMWRWDPETVARLEQITSLANELLPDFVDVSIEGWVNYPNDWAELGKVDLRCTENGLPVESMGHGVARWIATAVQIALHLISEFPRLTTLRDLPSQMFSGQVLLVDEPEAHLHPSAVASVVRWCRHMVDHGFTVMAASHHEDFLRAADDDVTLVHVTKGNCETRARTLSSRRTSLLLELAADIGIHPANTLSLLSAILFVEGPLDQAVLETYGGLELEAAGVKIIPIHGTKNLEGQVDAELATDLGMKTGVLLDATDPETMHQRSGSRRSSEERKVIKVIRIAKEKGLPVPKVFGVPEDDLLFALPADAIRTYLKGPFPGWKELRAECREALGKGPSDSVDWKSYGRKHYRLHIDTDVGVRDIVRALDLDNVPLPSIRRVIDEVVGWARS